MSSKGSSLAALAVKNPMFQKAAKDAVFESISSGDDDEEQQQQSTSVPKDGSVLNISEEELSKIQKWAKVLKFSMIGIATLLFIVSWYNFFGTSSTIATSFLAAYLFVFAMLLCCFELPIRSAALIIVQNFGFMYNSYGRTVFLSFVAILSYQISTFGKVMFGLIILYGLVSIFVNWKHPMFGKYLRTLHFFNRTKANKSQKQAINITVNM